MSVAESPRDDDEAPPENISRTRLNVDSGNSDNDNGLLTGNSMPLTRFKPSEDVYISLLTVKPNIVLKEIPRGRKANCCVFVNSELNVTRKAGKNCNRFWDDCGAWDRKQDRNVTTVFVRTDDG